MSWAFSVGLNIPVRDSDFGPPDPIECIYDLEGPDFYVTYDDGEKADNILFPFGVPFNGPGSEIHIKAAVSNYGEVSIQHGWSWRLEGGEWMFASSEELAEENACEAYMESIEDDRHDI